MQRGGPLGPPFAHQTNPKGVGLVSKMGLKAHFTPQIPSGFVVNQPQSSGLGLVWGKSFGFPPHEQEILRISCDTYYLFFFSRPLRGLHQPLSGAGIPHNPSDCAVNRNPSDSGNRPKSEGFRPVTSPNPSDWGWYIGPNYVWASSRSLSPNLWRPILGLIWCRSGLFRPDHPKICGSD